jgi:hypothetical protein
MNLMVELRFHNFLHKNKQAVNNFKQLNKKCKVTIAIEALFEVLAMGGKQTSHGTRASVSAEVFVMEEVSLLPVSFRFKRLTGMGRRCHVVAADKRFDEQRTNVDKGAIETRRSFP